MLKIREVKVNGYKVNGMGMGIKMILLDAQTKFKRKTQ